MAIDAGLLDGNGNLPHEAKMTTGRAILISAMLISVSVAGSTWLLAERTGSNERYQLVNTGTGSTVRLDRRTGDLVRCQQTDCALIMKDGKVIVTQNGRAPVPPPPPGYTLDR